MNSHFAVHNEKVSMKLKDDISSWFWSHLIKYI